MYALTRKKSQLQLGRSPVWEICGWEYFVNEILTYEDRHEVSELFENAPVFCDFYFIFSSIFFDNYWSRVI